MPPRPSPSSGAASAGPSGSTWRCSPASGRLDPAHPAFAAGAVAITTDDGAAELAGSLPESAVIALGPSLDRRSGARPSSRLAATG